MPTTEWWHRREEPSRGGLPSANSIGSFRPERCFCPPLWPRCGLYSLIPRRGLFVSAPSSLRVALPTRTAVAVYRLLDEVPSGAGLVLRVGRYFSHRSHTLRLSGVLKRLHGGRSSYSVGLSRFEDFLERVLSYSSAQTSVISHWMCSRQFVYWWHRR